MTEQEIIISISKVESLGGMTVNERLFVCGLIDEFDKALTTDKAKVKKILELLGVDKPSIEKNYSIVTVELNNMKQEFDFFKTTVPESRKATFYLGCLDSSAFTSRRAPHLMSITYQINTCCGSDEEMFYR